MRNLITTVNTSVTNRLLSGFAEVLVFALSKHLRGISPYVPPPPLHNNNLTQGSRCGHSSESYCYWTPTTTSLLRVDRTLLARLRSPVYSGVGYADSQAHCLLCSDSEKLVLWLSYKHYRCCLLLGSKLQKWLTTTLNAYVLVYNYSYSVFKKAFGPVALSNRSRKDNRYPWATDP